MPRSDVFRYDGMFYYFDSFFMCYEANEILQLYINLQSRINMQITMKIEEYFTVNYVQ